MVTKAAKKKVWKQRREEEHSKVYYKHIRDN